MALEEFTAESVRVRDFSGAVKSPPPSPSSARRRHPPPAAATRRPPPAPASELVRHLALAHFCVKLSYKNCDSVE